jgi:ATP-binding cassette subfamily B (MDR/TAP) protein 1
MIALSDRENYELNDKKGVLFNIWRLLRGTPDIWLWFAITVATCVAGGKLTSFR